MKKQFFIATVAFILTTVFSSCSRDYWDEFPETSSITPTTYMSVAFSMPLPMTRASADGQDLDNPNFNHQGKWAGNDYIEKVSIYVFNGTDNSAELETQKIYEHAELTTIAENNQLVVRAKEPFLVTKGNKKIYVVINPTTESDALLPATPNSTTLQQFSEKYESAELSLVAATGKSVADKLAKPENNQHVIMMTGAPITKNIDDLVTKEEARTGIKNNASMEFKRAVARVLVTTTKDSYTLAGYDPSNAQKVNKFVTIDNLHYVVAQGENHLYFQQKVSTDGTAAFTSPAFNQVPDETTFGSSPYVQKYNDVGAHYDYAGLQKNQTGNTTTVKGFSVKVRSPFAPTPTTVEELVKADLTDELGGQFVLPTLHKFATDETQTGYRKGNTPYVLVRARITPKKYIDASGQVSDAALAEDADLYYGLETGYFYVNKDHVTDAAHHGRANQKAYKYTKRVALYFAWLNPDDASKPLNSPVVRNNIYHLHITSISQLGSNWNPLVPSDKDNPDPFPNDNPNEPTTPRVFPHDPLYKATPIPEPNNSTPGGGGSVTPGGGGNTPEKPKVDETIPQPWMKIIVKVVKWRIHSSLSELSGL